VFAQQQDGKHRSRRGQGRRDIGESQGLRDSLPMTPPPTITTRACDFIVQAPSRRSHDGFAQTLRPTLVQLILADWTAMPS
jgi:hypothetical protein